MPDRIRVLRLRRMTPDLQTSRDVCVYKGIEMVKGDVEQKYVARLYFIREIGSLRHDVPRIIRLYVERDVRKDVEKDVQKNAQLDVADGRRWRTYEW
jgi:hypothetical protein